MLDVVKQIWPIVALVLIIGLYLLFTIEKKKPVEKPVVKKEEVKPITPPPNPKPRVKKTLSTKINKL